MKNPFDAIIWWIVIFFVTLFFTERFHHLSGMAIVWAAVIFLLIMIATFGILIMRVVNRQKAVIKLLQDGEIDQFLIQTDLLLKKYKNSDIIKINKSAGLYYKGAWSEGITLLNEVDIQRLKPLYRLLYANNRLSLLLLKGDFDEAQSLREQYDDLFKMPISNSSLQRAVAGTLAGYEFYLGDIQKARTLFQSLRETNAGRPSKATTYYFLGLIAMMQGEHRTGQEYLHEAEELGWNTFLPAQIKKDMEVFYE